MLNVKFTVEKKQLNVLFFQLFVDNHFKCSYYVRIVIFLNSKGCWENQQLNILNGE